MTKRDGKPTVSIVTPTYNAAKFLKETLVSIAQQSYEKIEHIVIDGGSTDGTLDILREYEGQVKWISGPDNGMYDALNKGFSMAQGEIFTYINYDDLYFSTETINLIVSEFSRLPDIDFLFGHCSIIDTSGRFLYLYKSPAFRRKTATAFGRILFYQPTCFWRKRVHRPFDSSYKNCGDADFFRYLCSQHVGYRINKPLAKFRVVPDSMSYRHWNRYETEACRALGADWAEPSYCLKSYDYIYLRGILNFHANLVRLKLKLLKRPYV